MKQARPALYLMSYRVYRAASAAPRLALLLLLVPALAIVAAAADDMIAFVWRLVLACLGVALGGLLVCWPSPLWFSMRFRRLVWFMSCAAGAMVALSRSFWVRSGASIGVVALLWWLESVGLKGGRTREAVVAVLGPAGLLKIMAATIVLALLLRAAAGRNRISIAAFENLAGDDLKAATAAVASRLGGLLDHLVDLYKAVDEERVGGAPGGTAGERSPSVLTDASISDTSEMLRGAISPDTKVKIGPVELPLAPLVAAGSLLVRGPSLTGSVQRVGDELTLLARIDGRRIHKTWRLCRTIGPDGAAATLADLTEELAYRMFTVLAEPGSQNWRAVKSYSDGLQTILRITRSRHDFFRNLRNAETKLIEALSEDAAFWPCHYNLGVVYLAKKNFPSARAAFSSALAGRPTYAEAAEGLCDTLWREHNDTALLRAADAALAIRADSGKAWDWRGWAQRRPIPKSGREAANKLRLQEFVPYERGPVLAMSRRQQWRAVIASREIASALAWRDLCIAARRRRKGAQARENAATFLINAGVAWTQALDDEIRPWLWFGAEQRAASLFAASIKLVRSAHASEQLGMLWLLLGQRQRIFLEGSWRPTQLLFGSALRSSQRGAAGAFRQALLIQESPERWAGLAQAEACRAEFSGGSRGREAALAALEALGRTLAIPPTDERTRALLPCASKLSIWNFKAEARTLAERYEKQVAMVADVSDEKMTILQGENAAQQLDRLQKLYKKAAVDEFGWAEARIAWQVGKMILRLQPARAEEMLRQAADRLLDSDRFKLDVFGSIVDACKQRKRTDLMLAAALEAVRIGPLESSARRLLGQALVEVRDFDEAEHQLEIALDIEPDNLDTLYAMVDCQNIRGSTRIAQKDRLAAQARSLEVLRWILEGTENTNVIRSVHYLLGVGHVNLEVFENAVAHYTVAMKLGFRPLNIQLQLGAIHYYRGAWDEADTVLRSAITDTWKLSRLASPISGRKNAPAIRDPLKKNRIMPADFEEDTPVNDTLLNVALWRSLVYADRGPDLVKARKMTRRAWWRLKYCAPDKWDEYRANCLACEGWIAYRGGDSAKAIGLLTDSVRLTAQADTYWRLARICLACAQQKTEAREEWRRKLYFYTSEARSADSLAQFTEQLRALEAALPPDSNSQKPAPSIPAFAVKDIAQA